MSSITRLHAFITDGLFSVQSLLVVFLDEVKDIEMALLELPVVLSYLFKKTLDFSLVTGTSDSFASSLEMSFSIRVRRPRTAPRRLLALAIVPLPFSRIANQQSDERLFQQTRTIRLYPVRRTKCMLLVRDFRLRRDGRLIIPRIWLGLQFNNLNDNEWTITSG